MIEAATTDRALLPYIRTYTGKTYRHTAPLPEDVDIKDIAHALSMICRFTGHTPYFYSVAEHCVRGSYFCEKPFDFLLHDASEAYCSDINRPLKYAPGMEAYKEYEELTQNCIELRFGLPKGALDAPEVKLVDNRMLATELHKLMGHGDEDAKAKQFPFKPYDIDIVGWSPEIAENAYLARFYELTRA